ncbi:MAG: ABC transporter permease [Mycobacteriales bacterium]
MLSSELRTLFGRARTRVLLVGLAAIPVLIALVVRFSNHTPPSGDGPAFLSSVPQNGVFAGLTGLDVVLPFLLPLCVAVVAGDSIAGEANFGTLRYLLTVPVGRLRLLTAKSLALLVFCVAATVAVVVAGLAAGAALFPIGRVVTLSGTTLPLLDGMGRILLAAGYVAVQIAALGAIGLFVSTLTDTPVAAMAATVVVAIVSEIIDAVPQVASVHPYLFSHDWLAFGDLLRDPVALSAIGHGLLLALVWGGAAWAAAWARFTTKDVLA